MKSSVEAANGHVGHVRYEEELQSTPNPKVKRADDDGPRTTVV